MRILENDQQYHVTPKWCNLYVIEKLIIVLHKETKRIKEQV